MCWPARSRLQLSDCSPDPQPYEATFGVTAFKHQVGSLRSYDLGIFAVLLDEQIGRAPDVDIRGHCRNSTTMKRPRNIGCPASVHVSLHALLPVADLRRPRALDI